VNYRFEDLIFEGEVLVSGSSILKEIPSQMAEVLFEKNGFVIWRGGFHFRGIVSSPDWHSLHFAWQSKNSLWRHFESLRESDIPFAEDCMGDQYILRDEIILKMRGEDGFLQSLELSFEEFLGKVLSNENDILGLAPLLRYESEGHFLKPGHLLAAYPPFITAEAANGNVKIEAIPTIEQLSFLSMLAKQLSDVPDGGKVRFVVKEDGFLSRLARKLGLTKS
jgi:hypothetical protein